MSRIFSTPIHAHVSGVHGPTGISALRHAAEAPILHGEFVDMLGFCPSELSKNFFGLPEKMEFGSSVSCVTATHRNAEGLCGAPDEVAGLRHYFAILTGAIDAPCNGDEWLLLKVFLQVAHYAEIFEGSNISCYSASSDQFLENPSHNFPGTRFGQGWG